MPNDHRLTQRAPLSCTSCASRKVRCSRNIPCEACINRGTAANCKREVVVVRGRVRSANVPGSSPSVAELLLENARLAALLSRSDKMEGSEVSAADLTEYYEKRLYDAVGKVHEPRVVACVEDIAMPTEDCSHLFVNFADTWTSWVHFAFFFPSFRQDHERFWSQGGSISSSDPIWLALYFAVLASALGFMSDADFLQSGAPFNSRVLLIENWFSAALFYLDVGDFIQKSDVQIVHAIVVLGNVASTIGETHRHANLWAVAIRIAQQLNLGSDDMNVSETMVERQARRRLWWTLVICEWIPIPLRTPCINNIDFDCQLPADVSDAQLLEANNGRFPLSKRGPHPVQYHIVMARIATIYYHLHSKLRMRRWSPSEVANFVIEADDQLAAVIEQLPPHLHNDKPDSQQDLEMERQWPWIATQRTSLVMVLLYYRLAINRILQAYWLEGSTNYARARSICLSSAVGVIRSAVSSNANFTRLRSWDFAMVVFSATVTLALEVERSEAPDSQFVDAIMQSTELLKCVKSQNKLASEALSILHADLLSIDSVTGA